LSFAAGDNNYGKNLSSIKEKDEESWLKYSGGLIMHAESSSSAAKRMFLELRDIRTSKVPFISAAPLGDSLDKVLASIEGPPETPYEGGIFWITVQLPRDPRNPPLLRFQTKIYHPNISPQGHICADY
jgi:ubiquitin-protein ligase